MNIEQHVTSLEISKKLKELGVKQESVFTYWATEIEEDGLTWWYVFEKEPRKGKRMRELCDKQPISAFLASELGELLLGFPYPATYETMFFEGGFVYFKISFTRHYGGRYPKTRMELQRKLSEIELRMLEERDTLTEADARGKMLIYLLENKLL